MKEKNKSGKPETQKKLEEQTLSQELRTVSRYLGELKFQKRLLGVDEADVWRKMEKVCELYEYAIEAERARADKAQKQLDALYARAREMKAARKTAGEAATREARHD